MGRRIVVIKVKWTCDIKGCKQEHVITQRDSIPSDGALPEPWIKVSGVRHDLKTGYSFPKTYYFCSREHADVGRKLLERAGIRIYKNWNTNA